VSLIPSCSVIDIVQTPLKLDLESRVSSRDKFHFPLYTFPITSVYVSSPSSCIAGCNLLERMRSEIVGWYFRHRVPSISDYVHSTSTLRYSSLNHCTTYHQTYCARSYHDYDYDLAIKTRRRRKESVTWRYFVCGCVCVEYWNLWDTPFLYHPNNTRMYTGRWTDQQLFSINKLLPLTRHYPTLL